MNYTEAEEQIGTSIPGRGDEGLDQVEVEIEEMCFCRWKQCYLPMIWRWEVREKEEVQTHSF